MSVREWKTQMETVGGRDGKDSCSTIYKTYNLPQARRLLNFIRLRDKTPRRKVSPVSAYILEDLIHIYLSEHASNGAVLEKITIKDSKHNAV